jgi:hypothetical protein
MVHLTRTALGLASNRFYLVDLPSRGGVPKVEQYSAKCWRQGRTFKKDRRPSTVERWARGGGFTVYSRSLNLDGERAAIESTGFDFDSMRGSYSGILRQ